MVTDQQSNYFLLDYLPFDGAQGDIVFGVDGRTEEREEGDEGEKKGNITAEPNGLKYISPAATPGADEREYKWEEKKKGDQGQMRKQKGNITAEPNGLKYLSPAAPPGADKREYEWEDGRKGRKRK